MQNQTEWNQEGDGVNVIDYGNVKWEAVDTHLPFSSIRNCRDLAGIPTKDGRHIKPGHLLRSASLSKADKLDLYTLNDMGLHTIIDLRTDVEMLAEPDRILADWQDHHLSVFGTKDLEEARKDEPSLTTYLRYPKDLAIEMYRVGALTKQAIKVWKTMFRMMIDQPGVYLWHCTQGKDRTGMAAILILNALGVEEPLIRAEYLQTNIYETEYNDEKSRRSLKELLARFPESLEEDIDYFRYAMPVYYDTFMQCIQEKAGSVQNYLRQEVGLSQEDLDAFCAAYLE